jgi:4,5-DOPA dioxygenase extradiol
MTQRMPVLFLGHGSPMNAIEDNTYSQSWRRLGHTLPRPRAILCVSAHWQSEHVAVTANTAPETIHDFYGFPQALFDVTYKAPGDPALAQRVADLLVPEAVALDHARGLDHGVWGLLAVMYPRADIPVVQLSMPMSDTPAAHYARAEALRPLRDEGVLILGSGNIVHNLLYWRSYNAQQAASFAAFNDAVKRRVTDGDHAALMNYATLTNDAALSVPTDEHYLPLLYTLAQQQPGDDVSIFNDAEGGAIFMTSVLIGGTS